jgi:hypothetical protein
VPRRVRVTQAGEMWLKPDGRALRFDAVAEVRWDFPEGSFTYWRGAVMYLELES